jgi:hypothetical protein
MPVSSLLSPEKIVGGRKVSPSSFQNFVSGGAPLGSSVVSSAANNVVGFQRASVRPATPDLSSIVNTISSNILSQVSNQIESVTNIVNKNVDAKVEQVRSEVTREIQPLYTKQENNITQLQSAVTNITQQADSTITKLVEEYRKKVSEVDDAKPTGILGNFLKVFKGALDFIQFFASKKNLDNLDTNLKSLQKIFADSFEVAKLIRNTINKIVGQLSNLPTASPSGSPGLNIDVKVPGQGLKQNAPKGLGNLMKKGGMFALGAGGLAAGAGAVNALADTGVASVQRQPGFMGGLVEGLGGIVESFTSAVNSLIKGSNDKSGGTSGGGGGAKTSPSGAPSTSSGPGAPTSTEGKSGPLNAKDIITGTPEEKAFIATVREAEGTAGSQGYNTFFGGSQYGGDLSTKTVTEVKKIQEKFLAEGRGRWKGGNSAAVGAGQFLYPEQIVREMGMDPSKVKFTPELQNQMILYLAKKKRGIDVSKELTPADFKVLQKEWAGLGEYYGQGGNLGRTAKLYKENLKEARAQVQAKGMGGPDLPDWALSPEKREELKNMATKVSQPPPSQAAPSVNVMPFDFSTQMPQQKSSGSQSPSSGPAAPAGAQGPTAPFLPAGNTDNFLILYSKIIYNIVDG